MVFPAVFAAAFGDRGRVEFGVAGVEGRRDEVEIHGGDLPQMLQHVQQHEAVLAPPEAPTRMRSPASIMR